jgi:hypothetical protein
VPVADPDATAVRVVLAPPAWLAAGAALAVIVALLALTAVTLINQRDRTVLLNHQLGTLLARTDRLERGVEPLLTVLRHDRRLAATVSDLDAVLAEVRRSGVVGRASEVLATAPAVLAQVRGVLGQLEQTDLIGRAGGAFTNLATLVRLQARSLTVQEANLGVARGTRSLAARTLLTAQGTLRATSAALGVARGTRAIAAEVLSVAQMTLLHAASLDRKVGVVP